MGNVTLDRRNLHAGPRTAEETIQADSGLRNGGFSGVFESDPDWIALQVNAGVAGGSGGSPDEPVWTPFNAGTLTNRRIPLAQTLVFSVGAATGIIDVGGVSYRLKVEGFDQFDQPVTEITPVMTLPVFAGGSSTDTVNFYLSQVFSYIKAVYIWEGPNPFTIGTVFYSLGILNEWLYTDTTGGTDAVQHVYGQNHGIGLPMRVQAIGSTAGDVFEDMGLTSFTITRFNGTQQIGVPADGHIAVAPSNDTAKPVLKIWNDATGGTFTLTYGGATTAATAYNATAATIKTNLEALATITLVDVSGAGTLANPWVVTLLDAGAVSGALSGDGALLTGATVGLTLSPIARMDWGGELDKFQFTSTAQAGAGGTCVIPVLGATTWGAWSTGDIILFAGNAHATKGALRGTVS